MMPIKNALIVVKEELILNKSKLIPQSPFKKGKKTSIHDQTLQEVQLSLVALGIQSKSILRSEVQHENIKNYDLIVTVGGDGTFLETSHFVFDLIPMIAVNSNPDRSHGAYCSATLESFYPTLLNLMKQKAPLFRLHRLQLSIRHKKIRVLALNDILFANACPAGTSRYEIQIGKKKEEQKSSGIWIATPSGSTAAIHSAGGKIIRPLTLKKIQYWVREPFMGDQTLQLTHGTLQNQSIQITSHMQQASLFIDGAHIQYDLSYNDKVEINLHPRPILKVGGMHE